MRTGDLFCIALSGLMLGIGLGMELERYRAQIHDARRDAFDAKMIAEGLAEQRKRREDAEAAQSLGARAFAAGRVLGGLGKDCPCKGKGHADPEPEPAAEQAEG